MRSGATIEEKGIHSIPLFAFSIPAINAVGGPFRPNATTTAAADSGGAESAEPYVVSRHDLSVIFFKILPQDCSSQDVSDIVDTDC